MSHQSAERFNATIKHDVLEQSQTPNPKPQTLNPKNPHPPTLHFEPYTPNPKPKFLFPVL